MNERLHFALDWDGGSLLLQNVSGHEAMCEPFRFVAQALDESRSLGPGALARKPVELRITSGRRRRILHGLVTRARANVRLRGATVLDLTIEPRLALLRHRVDTRVFRELSAPEIVASVLAGWGIECQVRLGARYESRPFCVQFRESDLDFVSRLLEDEGIFYFLLGEAVVLGDGPHAYEDAEPEPVPFRSGEGMGAADEHITALTELAEAVPGVVELRDFDFTAPRRDLDVRAPVPSTAAVPGPSYYDYPGEYSERDHGQARAERMAEAFACRADHIGGEHAGAALVPGQRFRIADAPDGFEVELVTLTSDHAWSAEDGPRASGFRALPAERTYRPERRAPIPTQRSPVTAFVTGPPGEDVHTDAWGRVKVHFHWDRRQPRDETCSHWVPVLQDNTGQSSAIPRVGWEVLVHFLEGDPDRPVVLGRVYNVADPFPLKLPDAKRISMLQSLSSPSRDGSNAIELDDAAGAEEIRVRAERDHIVQVANDKRGFVVDDELSSVGRDEKRDVGGDETASTGSTRAIEVSGDQAWSVAGGRSVKASSDAAEVGGDRRVVVGGAHIRRIGTYESVSAKHLEENVGGVILEVARTDSSTQSSVLSHIAAGGGLLDVAGGDLTRSAGKARSETVGGLALSKAENVVIEAAKDRSTAVAGRLTMESGAAAMFSAGTALDAAAPSVTLEATGSVVLEVGESKLVIKDGECVLTSRVIEVTADAKNELLAALSSQG